MTERVYFANHNFGQGEWGEVERGRNWIMRSGFVWERYLFRNGDRKLIVFSTRPWAQYRDSKRTDAPFPGEPRTHHQVWDYLAFSDPEVLCEKLGILDPEKEHPRHTCEDSGPISWPAPTKAKGG